MSETAGFLDHDGARLAWRAVEGTGPTLVWLGGFMSDLTGTKAQALADWALAKERAFVRFDYLGHGQSTGAFTDGTITRWRADALAVIDELTQGQLVLVGLVDGRLDLVPGGIGAAQTGGGDGADRPGR